MKRTPAGWPRISSSVHYDEPAKMIDWLSEAFGFEVRLKIEGDGGAIVHSELTMGDDDVGVGMVMVGSTGEGSHRPEAVQRKSPRQVGGANTQQIMVFVDDADAHCAHARKKGAVIVNEPKTNDYGPDYWTDRSYEAVDPEGHHWWFVQRIR